MPEPEVRVDNPPVDAAVDNPNVDPAPTPNPLEERLSQLESQLTQARTEGQSKDTLLAQYQQRLGELLQSQQKPAQPATQDDPGSLYNDTDRRFVSTVAEQKAQEIVQKTLSRLTLQADMQQRLGGDPEVVKAATTEYQVLKNNPAYAGLSDEVLQAFAVDRARSNVTEARYQSLKADRDKASRQGAANEQAAAATLPPTTGGGLRKPTTDDPDADLKHYMEQPESQTMFRKWYGADPNSDAIIKYGSERIPAKEGFKRVAIRAVRTGVGLSEGLRGAFSGGER